jgi:hypothetical protein
MTIDDNEALLAQVHTQALHASIQEAAGTISHVLGGQLGAYVVGVKDLKTLRRWASGSTTAIRQESESRLRTTYEIITLLLRFDGQEVVRAWFIGMAPELDDVSPARTLHEGRLREALGAARAFAANG